MKITITGSLGNISKPLTTKLVEAGHEITVISSNADRAKEIAELGAKPAIGSATDIAFLTETFKGSDVVYAMVPNNLSAPDIRKYIGSIGQHYATAIKAAGVNKIVVLSSIGAHLDSGTGPIAGLHDVEQILGQLENVDIKFLRPAYFYTNFYANIDMIKHLGFIGGNYSADTRIIVVHPNDIAEAAAYEIQQPFTGRSIRYIASQDSTLSELTTAFGKAIGKPETNWVEFTDEQALEGMIQGGLPAEAARNYVEMGTAIRKGILWEDYDLNKPVPGPTKVENFATEFAKAYSK